MIKKMLVILLLLSTFIWAGKSESKEEEIKRIRKELNIDPPTKYELKVMRVRKELGIEDPKDEERRLDSIRDELKIGYKKPENTTELDKAVNKITDPFKSDTSLGDDMSFDSAFSSIKKKLHLEKEKKDDEFSFSGTLNDFYDTVGLEKGESFGMPALFGFNEKQKKSSLFGLEFLGGIKDTGTTIHKGMKYSGQSAEFASGMMYRSSKMYNTMFDMYEASPFDFFEEEEASIFDVFEGGNTVLDIFD